MRQRIPNSIDDFINEAKKQEPKLVATSLQEMTNKLMMLDSMIETEYDGDAELCKDARKECAKGVISNIQTKIMELPEIENANPKKLKVVIDAIKEAQKVMGERGLAEGWEVLIKALVTNEEKKSFKGPDVSEKSANDFKGKDLAKEIDKLTKEIIKQTNDIFN
jgi:hypothetical protein